MRLPKSVIIKLEKSGVKAYFANREITKTWNSERYTGEPIHYGGWYWHRTVKGRVVDSDEEGPFKSESAALRDAWRKLQIR